MFLPSLEAIAGLPALTESEGGRVYGEPCRGTDGFQSPDWEQCSAAPVVDVLTNQSSWPVFEIVPLPIQISEVY